VEFVDEYSESEGEDSFLVAYTEYISYHVDSGDHKIIENYFNIYAITDLFDFIHGNSLEQFEQGFYLLDSNQESGIGQEGIWQWIDGVENDVVIQGYSSARFKLNSLSVRAIDNLTAVPEPSTMLLMITSVVSLGFVSRKKKQA
jgi:hypothetical protein